METQKVAVVPNVKVSLKSNAELLDEVVVTGYGVQRKASFTGAAAVVGEEALAKKNDAQLDQHAGCLGIGLCARTSFIEFRYTTTLCN